MRGNFGGTKKDRHPELVEGRTSPIPIRLMPPMKSALRGVRAVLFGAALVTAPCVRPALACSCAEPPPEVAYERAAAVFVGKVTSIERPFFDWLGITRSGDRLIHFAVTKRWKGLPTATAIVRAPLTGEACGYPFREGETYLVYAIGGVVPTTGICAGTKEVSIAGKDQQALEALAGKD
jgi:hypothetical protein